MNTKNILLGIFVLLTLVFASLTLVEYQQVSTLNSQARSSQSTSSPLALSFPRNESDIAQFCKFGQVVSGRTENQQENATGQTITTYFQPVLVMQVPSTAYVCVTYQSLVNNPQPLSGPNETLAFGFELRVCHRIGQSGMGCAASQALSGSAFPSKLVLTNSTTTFTVVYNITSTAGSMGFYDDAGDAYWGYPLAVGYQPSQLNSSDFHIVLPPEGGLYEPIQATSVSVIGMDWTYVAFQCASSPPSCTFGD
jgi:hypothetical protein